VEAINVRWLAWRGPTPTQCRVNSAPHCSGHAGGMADPALLKGRGLLALLKTSPSFRRKPESMEAIRLHIRADSIAPVDSGFRRNDGEGVGFTLSQRLSAPLRLCANLSGALISRRGAEAQRGNESFVLSLSLLALFLAGCGARPPQSNDTLVFLTEDIPAGLDSDGPAAAIATTQTGFVNLMEPLVGYARAAPNEDGVGLPDVTRFEGRLAERWTFDPATLTWTFTLRRGVRSCAGNELTADDVVYTFARAKSVSGAAPIGWFLASVGSVAGFDGAVLTDPGKRPLGDEVRKIDRYTVAIRQSAPNALFLHALSTFGMLIFDSREARAHATQDDPWSHDYINRVTAPGFGAYCVRRWIKGSEMVLEGNPGWFRGAPPIRRVVMKRVPESSNRFILMKMQQAQLAERLTPRELLKIAEVKGVAVRGVAGNENLFVHMNYRTPPFDDVRVRRAVAAALPVDWIIRNGYFGAAKPWTGVVPSSYPGFIGDAAAFRPDMARARALLAEAGYPGGRGLERFGTAFRLAYIAEKEATLGPIASAIRTALRDAGFPVELDPIPSAQYGDRQLVKKDLGFAINDQEKPAAVDAGYAIQLFFASPEAGGVNNMVNHSDKAVDAMWAEARNSADPARRATLVADIQRRLIANVAWAPVVEYRTRWAMSDRLRGIGWYPDNAVRFGDLSYTP
jgi:peptide/nickel transport system substrate-binding protein